MLRGESTQVAERSRGRDCSRQCKKRWKSGRRDGVRDALFRLYISDLVTSLKWRMEGGALTPPLVMQRAMSDGIYSQLKAPS